MELFGQKEVLLVVFVTQGCCELKEEISTRTYVCNPSIQPSPECLVINWIVNSRYGPYHL